MDQLNNTSSEEGGEKEGISVSNAKIGDGHSNNDDTPKIDGKNGDVVEKVTNHCNDTQQNQPDNQQQNDKSDDQNNKDSFQDLKLNDSNDESQTDAADEGPLAGLPKSLPNWQSIGVGVASVLVSFIVTGQSNLLISIFLRPLWNMLWTAVGTTLGIGLGLGLAMHVYETLEYMHQNHPKQVQTDCPPSSSSIKRQTSLHQLNAGNTSKRSLSVSSINNNSSSALGTSSSLNTKANFLQQQQQYYQQHHSQDEETSYGTLMASAGYDVTSEPFLRAQVMRLNLHLFQQPYYLFTDQITEKFKAIEILQSQWPSLPKPITHQLGRFLEHVMRDFVSSWYSYMDAGCTYQEERAKRKEKEKETEKEEPPVPKKQMVFTTARHRPIPMLNAVYHSMGIVFGNLVTRAEGVNVFSLLLMKWVKVLSQSFRVYRQLRTLALKQHQQQQKQEQQQKRRNTKQNRNAAVKNDKTSQDDQDDPNFNLEMAVARQFLLKGKLHRAITFGMDVPSLLFADAGGQECGVGQEQQENTESNVVFKSDDDVLEQRLFGTPILKECGMDYNRVLASRLVRALLPRAEHTSPIMRTLLTEMIAGNVLTPIMDCMVPDYVNGWILYLVDSAPEEDEQKAEDENENDGLIRGWGDNGSTATVSPTRSTGPDVAGSGTETKDVLASLPLDAKSPGNGTTHSLINSPTRSSDGVEMTISQADFFKQKDTDVVLEEEDEDDDEETEVLGIVDETMEADMTYGEHSEVVSREEDDDDEVDDDDDDDDEEDEKPLATGDFVLPLLTMSLIEMQRFMDFEECRQAQSSAPNHNSVSLAVQWNDPACLEAVTQLVLVVEASLVHGMRCNKLETKFEPDSSYAGGSATDLSTVGEGEVEVSVVSSFSSFSKVLLELTNDVDAFEDRIMRDEEEADLIDQDSSHHDEKPAKIRLIKQDVYKPTPADLANLRSLVAAWLQSGKAHRIISVLMNAKKTILKPYFHKHAFLRTRENAEGFVRQLRSLNGVDVLVDTMSVLGAPNVDVNEDGHTVVPKPEAKVDDVAKMPEKGSPSSPVPGSTEERRKPSRTSTLQRFIGGASATSLDAETGSNSFSSQQTSPTPTLNIPMAHMSSNGCPRFLDFRRNENFASSLRAERDRRTKSWANATTDSATLQIICRSKGSSPENVDTHREMHQISRIFYAGTNMVALRNGARRRTSAMSLNGGGGEGEDGGEEAELVQLSLLTVEMACQRRRLEVPDDDSSFLLRAQPRPLNAVGVHRDQRNHDMSFKCFAATFEEPAIRPGSHKFGGGKYIRKCLLRYFPNDRTAQIVLPQDSRQLDQRREANNVPSEITIGAPKVVVSSYLSSDFLRDRHLCQKWYAKGATPRSGSILASSVMETSDFNSVPRSGKAIDFVYRMSLFERPMVDLAGKKFTILDSASMGPHRADASALEMSDASLSIALFQIGNDWKISDELDDNGSDSPKAKITRKSTVEMGKDGYPIVWMKYTRKQGEGTVTEVKSYRTSYVRAALLVTAARQDAQMQCLIKCVKAGSARSATKQRTEAYLKPAAKLIEYANSPQRQKESVLLRDLKLGINHIDKDQLRRNGLFSPRFPTEIRSLSATVEGAAQVKESGALSVPGMATTTVFKIRCKALVALLVEPGKTEEDLGSFMGPDGTTEKFFMEEWVIYRSMKDFNAFHKHLKTQVAQSEQSASAGARLVGAATAAFTVGGITGVTRRRKGLIPSLGQASKTTAALTGTKKSMQKRINVLTGYLQYLLEQGHLLNRCSELLLFLGAFFPLPPDVQTEAGPVTNKSDPLGRSEMSRVIHETTEKKTVVDNVRTQQQGDSNMSSSTRSLFNLSITKDALGSSENNIMGSTRSLATISTAVESTSNATNLNENDTTATVAGSESSSTLKPARVKDIDMIPSIRAKIDEVPLAQVRSAIFELVRYQFDFDNASFFRNRIFAVLKTMSFAVASSGEFRKMLYESHIQYANAQELANWIEYGLNTLFPDGVFMESSTPLTAEELEKQSQKLKDALVSAFPDQLRSVLGAEIVRGGMDILHEMLQNRIVLKSIVHMLLDLLWLEIFPELQDILTGGSALETDS